MRRAAAIVVASLVSLACGDEPLVRREGHRAFYGTPHALGGLSLGRSVSGELLASWMEASPSADHLLWTRPGDDAAAVHMARLGDAHRDWRLSELVPVGDGFARFGSIPAEQFGELWIGEQGAAESFQRILRLAQTYTPFLVLGFGTEAVILVLSEGQGIQIWRRANGEWQEGVQRARDSAPCYDAADGTLVPFAAVASGGEIVTLSAESSMRDFASCTVRLRRILLTGEVEGDVEVTGDFTDPSTGRHDWLPGAIVSSPRGLGVLWLGKNGQIRVNTVTGVDTFDLSEALFDAEERPVAEPRLLPLDERRFVVTYRLDEGGVLAPTQAVVIDHDGSSISGPLDWPLDDSECVDSATVPRTGGLDYICAARCQGAACAEHWLYRGRVLVR